MVRCVREFADSRHPHRSDTHLRSRGLSVQDSLYIPRVSGDLARDLHRIDGRPYGHYRDLRGRRYALGSGALTFEHLQGDPFAAPSRLRVDIPVAVLRLPGWARDGADARRATADFLQRALRPALAGAAGGAGSGRSGLLEIAAAGQEVLERTGVAVDADGAARVRLNAGLPAAGRRILGRAAGTNC